MVKKISQPEFWHQTKQLLFLRYGKDEVDPQDRPPALLSLQVVAQLMQVPRERVAWLHRRYFASSEKERLSTIVPKLNAAARPHQKVSLLNVTDEEVKFICSQENQVACSHLSLKSRCIFFHRQFPDRWIKPRAMSKVIR